MFLGSWSESAEMAGDYRCQLFYKKNEHCSIWENPSPGGWGPSLFCDLFLGFLLLISL